MKKTAYITKEAKLPKEIRALFSKKELRAILHGKKSHVAARKLVRKNLGGPALRRFDTALVGHNASRLLGDAKVLNIRGRRRFKVGSDGEPVTTFGSAVKRIRNTKKKYNISSQESQQKHVTALTDIGKRGARMGAYLKTSRNVTPAKLKKEVPFWMRDRKHINRPQSSTGLVGKKRQIENLKGSLSKIQQRKEKLSAAAFAWTKLAH